MAKSLTFRQFQQMYPNNDACLAHLLETRYGKEPVCPKCGQIGTFHKLKKLPAYTCNCGHHVHPMAGTPFYRSRTPLTTWFHVMFLFCATRNGVSAKEIQRLTGVTYKTAWRIGHEIRKYMGWVDGDRTLGGKGGPRGRGRIRLSLAVRTRPDTMTSTSSLAWSSAGMNSYPPSQEPPNRCRGPCHSGMGARG